MDKFFNYVIYSNDCWLWDGQTSGSGYGFFYRNKKYIQAHRFSYEYFVGRLGKSICCHHCDNPLCVNPFHLFAGTVQDNNIDRENKKRGFNSRKTHCKHGHEFTDENTYVNKGKRACRQCNANTKRGVR